MTIRRQHLLASTLFTATALLAAAPQVAFAQEPTAAQAESTEVEELVVTGSRIPKNEFNSTQPIQVLTSERAQAAGVADTVQFLQNSTIAAGSPQVNPVISSAFVTDGGPGAATISLRGLGAQRTLVLMNGRRAGPAGTRGAVSTFDLNVLPESSIDHIDILKDGASSVYGSDAIAGVVNIITKKNRNGGEISAFYTDPFDTGGEQSNFSVSYGRTFDRFKFSVAADYYKQFEQQNGERSYTQCAEQYIFNPASGARSDLVDPRTGNFRCGDLTSGHVWVYGYGYDQGFFTTRGGRFQFSGTDNLQNFIPTRPGNADGVCPPTSAARSVDSDCYPGAPAGWFVVGYNNPTLSVQNANPPAEDTASLIPETTRTTLFGEASFDLTSNIQIYTELLANRRENKLNAFRQFWTYNYTQSGGECFFDEEGEPAGCMGNDPFSVGWTGKFILSPTPTTDWYDSGQRVDYTRAVVGLRGGFSAFGLKDWTWDIYGQTSRSLGTYSQQIILGDALDTQSFRTGSCVGTTTPISNRPCIDIPMTSARVLAGDLTQAEQNFLFDTDVGKTKYIQNYVEGTVGGNLFDLPAGPLGIALGFHIQKDKIVDTPGPATLAGNSALLSSAGITAGSSEMKEVYGELSAPLLKDHRFIKNLGLTLSGRYTDVDVAGEASTYKVGLNWQINDAFRIRATQGTSFRAPALFELYLADQTSFPSQRTVDPCINWAFNLAAGTISQRFADNCASAAGPGGGVPGDHTGSGSSATLFQGGGLGIVKPETSRSSVYGVVWTPKFADLSLSVDYFEIDIKDEVTLLGQNIPSICYNSLNFPDDPVCDLFVRNPGTHRIDTIQDRYINISNQENRGIDASVRYRHPLMWETDLTLDGQFTWQLEDITALFPGFEVDSNHRIGNPQFSGNIDATFHRGPWRFVWGAQLIGEQNSTGDFGAETVTIFGVTHNVKAHAEFQAIHHTSLRYDFKTASVIVGLANVFDKAPPQLTTVNSSLGLYNSIGTSVLSSQYTEGYYGRRAFVRVSKKF
jgi:iron complex outermembrane recepter protein